MSDDLAGHPAPGRALQIARNALSAAGLRVLTMVIGFGLTPFVVHAIGLQNYGLWAVVGSLAGYLGLLDFGLGGTFVKFITEYVEQGRRDRARQVMTFGMVFYFSFGLLLAIPVYFCAPAIVHLFKMPPNELGNAVALFHVMFLMLISAMVLGTPGAAVVAMHRMDLASRNNFIGYVLYALSTVIFVRAGYGVWGVVAGQAVQIFGTAVLQYFTASRLFGPIWHNPTKFDREILGRMFSFGGWTQANSILTILNLDVGRFISAGIVSVSSVAYYEIGSKLAFFSRSLPVYLLDAIMPEAAAAAARGDDAAIDRLYRSGTLYSLFATLAIGGFTAAAVGPILRVWMGNDFPFVGGIIIWLAVGYAVSATTGVGVTILRAAGMPKYETYFTGIAGIVNLLATIVLAPRLGIVGVALGTALGWCAGTVYFTVTYHRIRRVAWWPAVGATSVRLFFCAGAATALLALGVHALGASPLVNDRVLGIVGLALCGIAYLVVYVALAVLLGVFREDRPLIERRLSALGARLARFGAGRQAA